MDENEIDPEPTPNSELKEVVIKLPGVGEPDSSVSIVTGYGLGDRSSISGEGGGFFLYPVRPAGSGAHPDSHNGYRGPSSG